MCVYNLHTTYVLFNPVRIKKPTARLPVQITCLWWSRLCAESTTLFGRADYKEPVHSATRLPNNPPHGIQANLSLRLVATEGYRTQSVLLFMLGVEGEGRIHTFPKCKWMQCIWILALQFLNPTPYPVLLSALCACICFNTSPRRIKDMHFFFFFAEVEFFKALYFVCVYKRWCTRDFVDFLDPFFIRPELQPLQEQFFSLPKLSQMFLSHGTLMSVCANHFYFLPFIIMSVWFAYVALCW